MRRLPLPHAQPFLLLDRVIECDPGRRAVARRTLTAADPLLGDMGRLAAPLLAEAMAQCAGVALAALRPGEMAVFARLDRFRCKRRVLAGSCLEIEARVIRIFGATVKARSVVRVGGRPCAAGEIILQFVPHETISGKQHGS